MAGTFDSPPGLALGRAAGYVAAALGGFLTPDRGLQAAARLGVGSGTALALRFGRALGRRLSRPAPVARDSAHERAEDRLFLLERALNHPESPANRGLPRLPDASSERLAAEAADALLEPSPGTAAARCLHGRWWVRRAGEAAFTAMGEDEFAAFERAVAAAGGRLCKLVVTATRASLLRYEAGRLHGGDAAAPAVFTVSAHGAREEFFERGVRTGTRAHRPSPGGEAPAARSAAPVP